MCSTTAVDVGTKQNALKDLMIMMLDVCGKFGWIGFHHRAQGDTGQRKNQYETI